VVVQVPGLSILSRQAILEVGPALFRCCWDSCRPVSFCGLWQYARRNEDCFDLAASGEKMRWVESRRCSARKYEGRKFKRTSCLRCAVARYYWEQVPAPS